MLKTANTLIFYTSLVLSIVDNVVLYIWYLIFIIQQQLFQILTQHFSVVVWNGLHLIVTPSAVQTPFIDIFFVVLNR